MHLILHIPHSIFYIPCFVFKFASPLLIVRKSKLFWKLRLQEHDDTFGRGEARVVNIWQSCVVSRISIPRIYLVPPSWFCNTKFLSIYNLTASYNLAFGASSVGIRMSLISPAASLR